MGRSKLNITIEPHGTLSIYEQIVNQLKAAIVNGKLVAGEALPSIRMLASELEVSVITTKKAYEVLEHEGLIRSVAGKGFYVCENNKEYLKEKQLVMLEARFLELINDCVKVSLSEEDIIDMVRTLFEECGKAKR